MNIEKKAAELFALDDETWMEHSNPWSVYSRTFVFPFVALAIWSRVWLGWYAVIPVALSLLYMWLNPRLFGKPESTKNWASKAVLGERVWINREEVAVPDHHHLMPHLLNTVAGLGTLLMIWGLWELHIWATVTGILFQILAKYWFLDRMVWLFEDMKQHEKYGSWLY